jgi:MraZ protein
MFIGEHSHTIDTKGRLSIPAKYRGELAGGIVVTRGLDRCLWVYGQREWAGIAHKLSQLPISQKKSRAFARLMLAGAWDAELDSQGRVLIPEYLRRYAGLGKQAVLAGIYNRIEVWDEDSWSEYRQQTEAASEEIAEGMAGLGI